MKKRKILRVTYELLQELLDIPKHEFIMDIISESNERCHEAILIKIGTLNDFATRIWRVQEGHEIPREDLRTTRKEKPRDGD